MRKLPKVAGNIQICEKNGKSRDTATILCPCSKADSRYGLRLMRGYIAKGHMAEVFYDYWRESYVLYCIVSQILQASLQTAII